MQLMKYLLAASLALTLAFGLLYARAEDRLRATLSDYSRRVAALEALIAQDRQVMASGDCSKQERFWASMLGQQAAEESAEITRAAHQNSRAPK